jgi:hypothetical protein
LLLWPRHKLPLAQYMHLVGLPRLLVRPQAVDGAARPIRAACDDAAALLAPPASGAAASTATDSLQVHSAAGITVAPFGGGGGIGSSQQSAAQHSKPAARRHLAPSHTLPGPHAPPLDPEHHHHHQQHQHQQQQQHWQELKGLSSEKAPRREANGGDAGSNGTASTTTSSSDGGQRQADLDLQQHERLVSNAAASTSKPQQPAAGHANGHLHGAGDDHAAAHGAHLHAHSARQLASLTARLQAAATTRRLVRPAETSSSGGGPRLRCIIKYEGSCCCVLCACAQTLLMRMQPSTVTAFC